MAELKEYLETGRPEAAPSEEVSRVM
jgi:hypothetical protein